MQLPDSLLAPIEIGLNRYLAEDEQALLALGKLDNRIVALRLREFDLRFYMRLHAAGVQVMGACETADAEIEASIPALARAMLQPEAHQEMTSSGAIRIDGDLELAQVFFNILRDTDFDPEEWLSRYVGDVAAYRAGQFFKGALDFGRRSVENLFADGSRLIEKESGDLVAAEESREWLDGVDTLRSAVDRIEARIARLRVSGEEA